MKRKAPFYTGNFPGSANYDPNLPTGWNKWDAMESEDDIEEEEYDDTEEEREGEE